MITISQLIADLDRIQQTHGDLPVADAEGNDLPNLPPELRSMKACLPFELTQVTPTEKIKKLVRRLNNEIDDISVDKWCAEKAARALEEALNL